MSYLTKYGKMKKLGLLLAVSFLAVVVVFSGCRRDDNFNPQNVEGIDVTIPRIIVQNGKLSVFVSVADLDGKPIKGINASHLEIEAIKDGITTVIDNYNLNSTTGTPTPIASALTMDYSGSMYFDTIAVPAMETAVNTFIGMKALTDQVEIIKFDHNVHVITPFTTDTNLLYAGVADTTYYFHGSTAFYRACLVGLFDADTAVAGSANILPAVVGFTDGVNNQPPLTPDTVINAALQMQIPVYTVGFGGSASYQPDTVTLKHIADTTGGRFYWTPTSTELQQMYQYINGQLSNAVVIGFPWGSKANATIKVKVRYQGFTDSASKMIWY